MSRTNGHWPKFQQPGYACSRLSCLAVVLLVLTLLGASEGRPCSRIRDHTPIQAPKLDYVSTGDYLGLAKEGHLHPYAYPECQPSQTSRLGNFTFGLLPRPEGGDPLYLPPIYSPRLKRYVYPRLIPRWRAMLRSMRRTQSFTSGVRYIMAVRPNNSSSPIAPHRALRRSMVRALHYATSAFHYIKRRHAKSGVRVFTELELETVPKAHEGARENDKEVSAVKIKLRAYPNDLVTSRDATAEIPVSLETVHLSLDDWRAWPEMPKGRSRNSGSQVATPTRLQRGSLDRSTRHAVWRTVSVVQLAEMYASMMHREADARLRGNATRKGSQPTLRGVSFSIAFPGWMHKLARCFFIDAVHQTSRMKCVPRRSQETLPTRDLVHKGPSTANGVSHRLPKYTLIRATFNTTLASRVSITRRVRKRVQAQLARISKYLPVALRGRNSRGSRQHRRALRALKPRDDHNSTMCLRVEEVVEALEVVEVQRLQVVNATLELARQQQRTVDLWHWQRVVRQSPAYREFVRLVAHFDALIARPKWIPGAPKSNKVCVNHPGFEISLPFQYLRQLRLEERARATAGQNSDNAPETISTTLTKLRVRVVRKVKRWLRRIVSYIPLPDSWKDKLSGTATDSPTATSDTQSSPVTPSEIRPGFSVISITSRPLPETNASAIVSMPGTDADRRRAMLERDHFLRAERQRMDAARRRRVEEELRHNCDSSAYHAHTPIVPAPTHMALGPEALAGFPSSTAERWNAYPRLRESVNVFPPEGHLGSRRRFYRGGSLADGTYRSTVTADDRAIHRRSYRQRRCGNNKLRNYFSSLDPASKTFIILISVVAGIVALYGIYLMLEAFFCPSMRRRAREGSHLLDEEVDVIVRQSEDVSAPASAASAVPATEAISSGLHAFESKINVPAQTDSQGDVIDPRARRSRIPTSLRSNEMGRPLMQDYAPSPTHHAPVMPSLLDEPVKHVAIQPGANVKRPVTASPAKDSSSQHLEYSAPDSSAQVTTPTSMTSSKQAYHEDLMTDESPYRNTSPNAPPPLDKPPAAVEQLRQANNRARKAAASGRKLEQRQ